MRFPPPSVRKAVRAGPQTAGRRLRAVAPIALQCALATGIAWWVADTLLGHSDPVFAGTAAVVCLAAGTGGRARQAVDLLAGVLVGVLVGQAARAVGLEAGAVESLVVVTAALLLISLTDTRPLALIQAGASALFVLTLPPVETPMARFLDAAVGGAIGLLFSQALFTPHPVRLVTGHLGNVLREIEAALGGIAHAAQSGDRDHAADAVRRAHAAADLLGPLTAARRTGRDIAARTLRGRRHAKRLHVIGGQVDDAHIIAAAVLLLTDDILATITDGARIDPAVPAVLHRLAHAVAEVRRHLPTESPGRADALSGVRAELARLLVHRHD